MVRYASLSFAVLPIAAACAPVAVPADTRTEESNTEKFLKQYAGCSTDGLAEFVGRPATTERVEAVQALSGATSVRIVRAGEPMSMDAQAGRLTVELDRDGSMRRFTCG